MKKTIFILTIILSLFLAIGTCFAASSGVFDDDARIVLSGNAINNSADISVSVLGVAQEGEPLQVVYANQIKPNSDGTFSITVNMQGAATGEYNIRVFQKGKKLYDFILPYALPSDSRNAIEALNAACSEGYGKAAEYISVKENRIKLQFAIPFEIDGYTPNMADTAKLIVKKALFDTSDKTGCAKVLSEAAVAAAVADGKIENLLEYSDEIAVMSTDNFKSALNSSYVTDDAKSRLAYFVRVQKPFETLESFEDAVRDALILAVAEKPSGAEDIKSAISALRPTYNVSKLTSDVLRNVAYKTYSSFKELEDAINASQPVVKPGQDSGGGGGGGKIPVTSPSSGNTEDIKDPTDYENPGKTDEPFNDMAGFQWAKDAVYSLRSMGIVSGSDSGVFRPQDNITREEFVKLIVLAFDLQPAGDIYMQFADADAGQWYYPYLQIGYSAGIIKGIDGNRFGVGEPISRQDAAVILHRCMMSEAGISSDYTAFSDGADISAYARESVAALYGLGIISGYDDGTFRPMHSITRAEAAKLIYESISGDSLKYTDNTQSNGYETAKKSDNTAFGLLSEIGVFDNGENYDSKVNQSVSRGEFAIYLAKLLKVGNITSSNGLSFYDVASGSELGNALSVLSAMGIIKPDENGLFRPNDPITVAEITKALIYSYTDKEYRMMIEEKNDYLYTANRLGITDGIKSSGNASFGDCVVMLYNTINSQYKKDYSDSKATLLEELYGIYFNKGRMTANCYTAISGQRTRNKEKIGIDGVVYYCSDSSINDLIGYTLDVYYTEIDGERTVVFWGIDRKNTVTKFSAEDVSYSDFTLTYYENNRKKTMSIGTNSAIIKNGAVVGTNYNEAFSVDFGTVTVISDGENDTVVIESYDILKVTGVDVSRKKVYAKNLEDDSVTVIDFNEDSKKWVFFKSYPYGREVNETILLTDDILCVSVSDDGSYMNGFQLSSTVNGTVSGVETDAAGYRIVTIDGVRYKVAKSYKDSIQIGKTKTFVTDISGRIVAEGKDVPGNRILGYVYAIGSEGKGLNKKTGVKIFNVSRTHETLSFADNVIVDGVRRTAEFAINALCTGTGGVLKRQLIFYTLNSDNEIKEIDLAANSGRAREGNNTLEELLPAGSYPWLFTMKTFDRKYAVSSKTYYMRVPSENIADPDESLFGVQAFSNVTWWNDNNAKSILGLYSYDDSTPFADILLVAGSENATLNNTVELTMVDKIYQQLVGDRELTALHGLQKGLEVTAYFDSGVYQNDIEVGDLVRFATTSAGYIGKYEKIYDASEDKVMWSMSGTADEYTSNTTPNANLRYTFGYVNKLYNAPFSDGLNTVVVTGRDPQTAEDMWQFNSNATASTRYIVYDSERVTDKVYMAGIDEIVSWEACNDKDATTRVFVHTRQGYLSALFIYK